MKKRDKKERTRERLRKGMKETKRKNQYNDQSWTTKITRKKRKHAQNRYSILRSITPLLILMYSLFLRYAVFLTWERVWSLEAVISIWGVSNLVLFALKVVKSGIIFWWNIKIFKPIEKSIFFARIVVPKHLG